MMNSESRLGGRIGAAGLDESDSAPPSDLSPPFVLSDFLHSLGRGEGATDGVDLFDLGSASSLGVGVLFSDLGAGGSEAEAGGTIPGGPRGGRGSWVSGFTGPVRGFGGTPLGPTGITEGLGGTPAPSLAISAAVGRGAGAAAFAVLSGALAGVCPWVARWEKLRPVVSTKTKHQKTHHCYSFQPTRGRR